MALREHEPELELVEVEEEKPKELNEHDRFLLCCDRLEKKIDRISQSLRSRKFVVRS